MDIREKFIKLIAEAQKEGKEGDKTYVTDFMNRATDAFLDYFVYVVRMEKYHDLYAPISVEHRAFRERLNDMDKRRRELHMLATRAVNMVNRLCKKYGMEYMFDVHGVGENGELSPNVAEDRAQAVIAVFVYCTSYFLSFENREKMKKITGKSEGEIMKALVS